MRKKRKMVSAQMKFLCGMKLMAPGNRERIGDIRNALDVNKKTISTSTKINVKKTF